MEPELGLGLGLELESVWSGPLSVAGREHVEIDVELSSLFVQGDHSSAPYCSAQRRYQRQR